LVLTPKPSRAAWLWWGALHLLLVVAAMLVAWSWPVRVLVSIAIVSHGIARRPRKPPPTIVVGADGRCSVPQWQIDELPLGAGTLVCPYWVRLGFGTGPRRRDIVLFIDQLDWRQWALLRACLLRLRCA
jgi:hypothetical protein